MKVKTRSKSQIKRQQILAAATELFTELVPIGQELQQGAHL